MSSSLESAPLSSSSAPRKSRTPLIIIVVLLALGAGAAGYYFFGRSKSGPTALARGIPKGVSSVVGVNFKSVLENEQVKPLVGGLIVQAVFAQAKNETGVDLNALQSAVVGVQLADNKIHVLTVLKGVFEAEKLNALLAKGSAPVEVKGKKFTAASSLPIPGMGLIRRKGASRFEDEDRKAADKTAEEANAAGTDTAGADAAGGTGDAPPGKASVVEPPKLPEPPALADVLVGLADDTTLLVGSQVMLEKYLTGGDTVADDADLGPLVSDVAGDAIFWGVGKFKQDSPEGKILQELIQTMPESKRAEIQNALTDVSGLYEIRLVSGSVEARVVLTLGKEDVAKMAKDGLDGLLGGEGAKEMLETSKAKVDVKLEGSKLTITGSYVIPDLAALMGGPKFK